MSKNCDLKILCRRYERISTSSSRGEEVWREHVLRTCFCSLIVLRRFFFWSCVKLRQLRQSTSNNNKIAFWKKYIQIHTRGLLGLHLSSLSIPHGLWTPQGNTYTLKHTTNVMRNVNTLFLLFGYCELFGIVKIIGNRVGISKAIIMLDQVLAYQNINPTHML